MPLADLLVNYIADPKTRQRIQSDCIDPLLDHVIDRVRVYVILLILTVVVTFVMTLMLMTVVFRDMLRMRKGAIGGGGGL